MSATNDHLKTLFTIQDKNGHIIHTMVSLTEEDAIRELIEQQEVMILVANVGRCERGEPRLPKPNWEHMQAEGYKTIPISIIQR